MNVIRYEDSGTSKWIRKCLTTTSGEKHMVSGFWDFYGPIDSELQNVQEAGSDGWELDRFSYNFFALMEKVDPYIRSYKRHVYSFRPWGFEFCCIKCRVNLMLNVKESVTFAAQKCIGVSSPYTVHTYVTMKNLTCFLYALCTLWLTLTETFNIHNNYVT
jgi:hypothetical protein